VSNGSELFLIFVRPLNGLGLDYMVTGSVASMAYGTPRVTLDIDLVLELAADQAERLPVAFPSEDFYCPPTDAIQEELRRPARGQFNVIHVATGFKADFYPVGDDPFLRWGLTHRRQVEIGGETAAIAPPEYVIVKKLEYFREGGSEKHLRDIRDMFDVSADAIDRAGVEAFVEERDLQSAWGQVWKRSG